MSLMYTCHERSVLRGVAVAVALLLCLAQTAQAQALRLEFNNGRVSLNVQNVPLRGVLAEWARLGGTTIVNGDAVIGPPITLTLEDVPERQVLDILLRNVSGYMLASRQTVAPGLASFDRIMILPTSSAPPPVTAAPGFQGPRGGGLAPPRAVQVPVEAPDNDQEPNGPPNGEREVPVIPTPFNPPPGETPAPTPGTEPTTSNPFGVPFGTTTRPGVITPQPQQPNNARPAPEP